MSQLWLENRVLTDNLHPCGGVLFETNGQLVALEELRVLKICNGIITNDFDIVIVWYCTVIVGGQNSSTSRAVVPMPASVALRAISHVDVEHADFVPELAAWVGCDFLPRIHGFSPEKVLLDYAPPWRQCRRTVACQSCLL